MQCTEFYKKFITKSCKGSAYKITKS